MCRTELCVVAPPEETASVHHRVGDSGIFLCRIHGTEPFPYPSSPSQPRRVEVGGFLPQNTSKTM